MKITCLWASIVRASIVKYIKMFVCEFGDLWVQMEQVVQTHSMEAKWAILKQHRLSIDMDSKKKFTHIY